MADNYLERRMEEHRAMQQTTRSVSRPVALRPGRVVVDYPQLNVVITEADSEGTLAIVRKYVEMKCRVSITVGNQSTGSAIAQRTGSRYIPGSLDTALAWMAAHGEHPDVIVDPVTMKLTVVNESPGKSIDIDPRAISSGEDAVACWCVFASHPANSWLYD